MTGKNVVWLLVYYAIVVAFVWFASQDRPAKVLYYYYLDRASWKVAKVASRMSIKAEEHYRVEVERSR